MVEGFLFFVFAMGFALGMGIDCGGGGDCFFFFWGNFGGEELVFVAKFCGCVALPEREREGKEMRVNCLYYLASKLYIEIKTRM